MTSQWTDQRDTDLKLLMEAGSTYQVIAHAMGTTRSAVAGRAARLGLRSLNDAVSGARERGPRMERAPRPPAAERITPTDLAKLRCVRGGTSEHLDYGIR
jgi:hypothetical protein